MKCDLCHKEIVKSFLGKIKGTYIKINGNKKIACDECQSKYKKDLKGKLS